MTPQYLYKVHFLPGKVTVKSACNVFAIIAKTPEEALEKSKLFGIDGFLRTDKPIRVNKGWE